MERNVNNETPDASTLWLAIGVGGISVLASFFLAIYFATVGSSSENTAIEAQPLEVSASPTE